MPKVVGTPISDWKPSISNKKIQVFLIRVGVHTGISGTFFYLGMNLVKPKEIYDWLMGSCKACNKQIKGFAFYYLLI